MMTDTTFCYPLTIPGDDRYPQLPGLEHVWVSEYPADRCGVDSTRLEAVLEHGIRVFIDLTEADEEHRLHNRRLLLSPYERKLKQLAAERGMTVAYHRIPVRDVTAPTVAQVCQALDLIDAALAARQPVLIHCLGGIGRSATVAACLLVRHGYTPTQALHAIQHQVRQSNTSKRFRDSPETHAQKKLVRDWPSGS
ncbi:MAG: hypothetical protein HC837_16335 [Chloroflexaceae bacterium]|nr:hypothetical protein [Chloroflexaceae bacterium]